MNPEIISILQAIGFTSSALQKLTSSELPWRINISWSSCDHDHWNIRRNKLKENDIHLNASIEANSWKIVLEAKHNLYRLEWRPSGIDVTSNLPKYSRMTRWPTLDIFLQLPDLVLQLEQMPEFKQKNQVFSRQVKLDSYFLDFETDLDQEIFKSWSASTLNKLLLPVKRTDSEDDDEFSDDYDYPEATTEPGYPFADTNLKLAVMDSLISDKLLDLGKRDQFYQFIYQQNTKTKKDKSAFFKTAYDYLSCYPLTDEQLKNVHDVYLDGSSDIYFYMDKYYDGETDKFWIKSLETIEGCQEITEFSDCEFAVENLDLSPLAKLTKLEKISLSGSSYSNTQILLSIPSLTLVECYGTALDKEIIDALLAKGIPVKTYS